MDEPARRARVAAVLRGAGARVAFVHGSRAAGGRGVKYLFVTAIGGCVDVARLADLSDLDAFVAAVAARL